MHCTTSNGSEAKGKNTGNMSPKTKIYNLQKIKISICSFVLQILGKASQ